MNGKDDGASSSLPTSSKRVSSTTFWEELCSKSPSISLTLGDYTMSEGSMVEPQAVKERLLYHTQPVQNLVKAP